MGEVHISRRDSLGMAVKEILEKNGIPSGSFRRTIVLRASDGTRPPLVVCLGGPYQVRRCSSSRIGVGLKAMGRGAGGMRDYGGVLKIDALFAMEVIIRLKDFMDEARRFK